MDFLDNLTRKLNQVSQDAVSQTKVFAETTRINAKISDEERQLDAMFAQLGRNYFEANKDNPNAAFAETINNIKDSMLRIENYKVDIRRAKGVINCPQCGAEVSTNTQFCSYCGGKLPVTEFLNGTAAGFTAGVEGLGENIQNNGVYSSPNTNGTSLNYNTNLPTYDITAFNTESNTSQPIGGNSVSLEKKD